jgi:plasmid stabilization system protein ParE
MSFEIKFSSKAETTFNNIIIQLEQRWGGKFVNKFKDKVSKSLDLIADTPLIYSVAPENPALRKCILHKNCSLLYRIHNDEIEIVYFWDNRQEPLTIP